MTKVRNIALMIFLGLISGFFSGPTVPEPTIGAPLPQVEGDLHLLEAQIADSEKHAGTVKPDNEARIVWADTAQKVRTPFSVVYLHGLEGSQGDGLPIHTEFARRYGCNLFLSRLYGHGLVTDDALADLTPEKYLESAMRAVSIGEELGDKVIVMATSTGATLGLMIAAHHPQIAALIFYSPNIDFHNKAIPVLAMHWGLQLGRLFHGGKYVVSDDPDSVQKYWYPKFRLEGVAAAKCLIDKGMNRETFASINQPIFVGYYYKDETHQDDRVSVPRILDMFDQIATPAAFKRKVAFPNVGTHPLASSLISRDINSVRTETFKFAEEILLLPPVIK